MESIRSRESLVSELLFEALRVKNDRLNTLATEVFAALGPCAAGRLLREAINRKNPLAYRLRLLHAVECVGEVAVGDEQTMLFTLLHDKSAQVRDAAARVIVRLGLIDTGCIARESEPYHATIASPGNMHQAALLPAVGPCGAGADGVSAPPVRG